MYIKGQNFGRGPSLFGSSLRGQAIVQQRNLNVLLRTEVSSCGSQRGRSLAHRCAGNDKRHRQFAPGQTVGNSCAGEANLQRTFLRDTSGSFVTANSPAAPVTAVNHPR